MKTSVLPSIRTRISLSLVILVPLSAAPGCGNSNSSGVGSTSQAVASTTSQRALAGINFPPTQGTTNSGAFLPGVYNWGYSNADIAAANATFNIMRLPINEATANDPGALQTMKGYVDQFADQRAIICMFGTVKPNGSNSHGDGLPDGLAAMGAAWAKVISMSQVAAGVGSCQRRVGGVISGGKIAPFSG